MCGQSFTACQIRSADDLCVWNPVSARDHGIYDPFGPPRAKGARTNVAVALSPFDMSLRPHQAISLNGALARYQRNDGALDGKCTLRQPLHDRFNPHRRRLAPTANGAVEGPNETQALLSAFKAEEALLRSFRSCRR